MLTSALGIWGLDTWLAPSTQSTLPEPSGGSIFNTITSKPSIPTLATSASPAVPQSSGSDRVVVSGFRLFIPILAISLLFRPFIGMY